MLTLHEWLLFTEALAEIRRQRGTDRVRLEANASPVGSVARTSKWSGFLDQRPCSARIRFQKPGRNAAWVVRYSGHDVSNEPRDELGRWARVGGGGDADEPDGPVASRPGKSGKLVDIDGRHVGYFDFHTGWVRRSVQIGDGPAEVAVAHIDDVVTAVNRARGPASNTEWNDWFIREGHPVTSADPTAPGYTPLPVQNDADALVPQGPLRAISGFGSDGEPRALAASMAGPTVVKLLLEVGRGLLDKYVGGKVVGLGVNTGGKLVARISRNGKIVVEELSDRMANQLRRNIDRTAANGTKQARQLKAWLGKNAPDPNWKSSLRKTTGENSELLRKNMGEVFNPGEDAHHIVQSGDKRAVASQKLLDRFQIDINAAANGVRLKRTGNKPAHKGNGLHSNDGILRVAERLKSAVRDAEDWASGREALLTELAKLKNEIKSGAFP